MKKRLFSFLLVLSMLLTLLPAQVFAADTMTLIGTTDWVNGKANLVTEYNEEYGENATTYFSFDIPKDGATVLIFYDSTCEDSQYLFRQLNEADWLGSEYVNVVALESEEHYGPDVEAFRETYAPDVAEHIRWAWDANKLVWSYGLAYFGAECQVRISYPFVLVITGTENNRTMHSGNVAMTSCSKLFESIKDASDAFASEDYTQPDTPEMPDIDEDGFATVTVAGTQRYDMAQEVYEIANLRRKENGAAALSHNKTLNELAMLRAAEVALFYDHERPRGESFFTVFDGEYIGYTACAENIAAGQASAQAVMTSWMNSEGHRRNLLNTAYTQIGVGCYESNGVLYWVQLFGNSRTNTATTDRTDAVDHATKVKTKTSRILPVATGRDELTMEVGEEVYIYLEVTNAGWAFGSALLLPRQTDVRDASGKVLATMELFDDGSILLTGVAPGEGQLELLLYEGQEGAYTLDITVEGEEPEVPDVPVGPLPDPNDGSVVITAQCRRNYERALQLLTEINKVRQENGMKPMFYSHTLCELAMRRVAEASVLSGGYQAGDHSYVMDEVPAGWENIDDWFSIAWKEDGKLSGDIQEMILDEKRTHVGIGCQTDGVGECYALIVGSSNTDWEEETATEEEWSFRKEQLRVMPNRLNIRYTMYPQNSQLNVGDGINLYSFAQTWGVVYLVPQIPVLTDANGKVLATAQESNSLYVRAVSPGTVHVPMVLYEGQEDPYIFTLTIVGDEPEVPDVPDVPEIPDGPVTWKLENGVLTISGTGEIIWGNQYNSYNTPEDEEYIPWWDQRSSVREIVIEEGITVIGDYLFSDHTNVRSVTIPSTVTAIKESAFDMGCKAGANIPVHITDLAAWYSIEFANVFSNPGYYGGALYLNGVQLDTITVPDSVTEIKSFAFYNNPASQILLPDGITAIGTSAFEGCVNLKTLELPDSITVIGESAFQKTGLTYLELPKGLKTIDMYTFSDCANLEEVVIPEGVTNIVAKAFEDCTGLKRLTIPGSVTDIGYRAFAQCENLQIVVMEEGVRELHQDVFFQCPEIISVILPASLKNIGEGALDCAQDKIHFLYAGTQKQLADICDRYAMASEAIIHYEASPDKVHEQDGELYCDLCGKALGVIGDTEPKPIGIAVHFLPYDNNLIYYYRDDPNYVRDPAKNRLNLEGGYIVISYNRGPAQYLDMRSSEITATGLDINTPGTQTITLTWNGLTTTFEVRVRAVEYDVVFKNWNGEILSEATYYYGDPITVPNLNPERPADGDYTYIFKGWSADVETTCTGSKTYTARYQEIHVSDTFALLYCMPNGERIGEFYLHYGESIEDWMIPYVKAPEGYVFVGWDREIPATMPAERLTITAVFEKKAEEHKHSFGLWVIDTESVLGGAAGTKHRTCECGQTEYESYTNPLTDVANGKYFSKPVFWAYENGITKGKTATEFQLDADCTRKQIVMFLWRAAGEPEPKSMVNPFADVKADSFQKAILWAYYEGITSGKTATEFQPEAPCTREQIVMFLWRYFGKPEPKSMKNPFEDVRIGGTFEKAILWAYYEGITTGKTSTTFEPQATCTRGQIVTFLYRAMVE